MIASIRLFFVRVFWCTFAVGFLIAIVDLPLFDRLVARGATHLGRVIKHIVLVIVNQVVVPNAEPLILLFIVLYLPYACYRKAFGG